MNKLGFWKEFYFRGDNLPSIHKNGSLKKRNDVIDQDVINYLKSGVWLYKVRSIFECIITGEYVGTPYVYTDGEWFWTTEYIYYLENYDIFIPEEFLKKIVSNNYQPLSEEELGKELIASLEKEIKGYGY